MTPKRHQLFAPPEDAPKPPRKKVPIECYLVLIALLQIAADTAQLFGVSPL